MKEFLSVKEFSDLSGIETTTLRYWDEIGLFCPAKRDSENNYRYYSPQQMVTVNFITVLSNLSVPLKTIGEMDGERTPEKIISLINRQEQLLDMEMLKLRERYSIIHTRRELINEGVSADVTQIFVSQRDEKAFILGPRNEFKTGKGFYEPFMHFCRQAKNLRMNLCYPIGGYHENVHSFFNAPGEPDYFLSLDPTGNRKSEVGEYLIGFARGYYGEFGDLHERMAAYAEENSLAFLGPVYTMYLLDEICIKDPSKYLVQACVAVSKKLTEERNQRAR